MPLPRLFPSFGGQQPSKARPTLAGKGVVVGGGGKGKTGLGGKGLGGGGTRRHRSVFLFSFVDT